MLFTDLQYFGTIDFIKILLKHQQVNYDTTAPFTKMSFKNRMVILTAQGPLNLSIPIIGGRDQKTPLGDIFIDYESPWNSQHFKAIITAYKRAPYFEYYEQSLSNLYAQKQEKLIDFLLACQHWLNGQLKANWEISSITDRVDQELDQKQKYFSPWLPKNYQQCILTPKYQQVFEDKIGFINNVSILDFLFSAGGKQLYAELKK
ncbi:MAG: WbqC family protein [Bacteroidetes bacterium]|nr:WbqC family protein [Bacteroidota bacterium]